jgi:hypothetical protein
MSGLKTKMVSGSLAATLALALSACGGGGVTPAPLPTPTPTPVPPPRVVSHGSIGLEAGMVLRTVFTTTLSGRLDATVNWTFVEDDLDVYVTPGVCTFEQFFGGQCPPAGFSESETAKPEAVTVQGAAPGSYTLFVGNLGPRDESLSWQVVLTPGAAATAFSMPASSPSRTPARLRALRAGEDLGQ